MSFEGSRWRGEIDAVEVFIDGDCRVVIHRNVFRTLRGAEATPEECLSFLMENAEAVMVAARIRMREANLAPPRAFHLNSRQIRRAMEDLAKTAPAPR